MKPKTLLYCIILSSNICTSKSKGDEDSKTATCENVPHNLFYSPVNKPFFFGRGNEICISQLWWLQKGLGDVYTYRPPAHPPSFPSPTYFIKPPLWYLTESLWLWVRYKCFVYRLFIFTFDRKDKGLCVIFLSLRGLSSRKGLHS